MKKNSSFFLWLKARKRKQDEKRMRREEKETTTTTQRWRDKTGPAIGYCSKFFWLRIFLFLRSYHRCCYFLLFSCVRISLFFLLSVLLVSMSRLFFFCSSSVIFQFLSRSFQRFLFTSSSFAAYFMRYTIPMVFGVCLHDRVEPSRCLKHLRDVACTKACTLYCTYIALIFRLYPETRM